MDDQLPQEHLIKGNKGSNGRAQKNPQEQAKAKNQMVKKECVSDLTYNLLLIYPRENVKGQIYRRVSVGLSHLHGQTSTQMIFSNLLTLFSKVGTHLTC